MKEMIPVKLDVLSFPVKKSYNFKPERLRQLEEEKKKQQIIVQDGFQSMMKLVSGFDSED